MAQRLPAFFNRSSKPTTRIAAARICALLLAAYVAPAQEVGTNPTVSAPARAWAVDAANNEVLVIQHPNSFFRYRYHTVDEKGDQTRDLIETPNGSVARLLLRNGRPLTPEEDAAERGRLNAILQNPSGFARHIRREQENKKMGVKLIRLMPDAFLWSYTPGQPQLPGSESNSGALVVLDFKPNPKWSAPDIESEPLTGVEGRAWIDPHSRRVVRLEAKLTRAVNIGLGMLAHLYPGGTATVDQTNAGGDRWIVKHIVEQLTIRALLVKTVKQRLKFDTAEYQPVRSMTFQEAIKMLLDTPLPQH
jgi:hypothetical protein